MDPIVRGPTGRVVSLFRQWHGGDDANAVAVIGDSSGLGEVEVVERLQVDLRVTQYCEVGSGGFRRMESLCPEYVPSVELEGHLGRQGTTAGV